MPTSPAEPDRRTFLGILAATAAAASGCTAATTAPAVPISPPSPAPASAAAADPNKALRDLVLSSDVEPAFAFRASPLRGEPR